MDRLVRYEIHLKQWPEFTRPPLFELVSQRNERSSILITSNLPIEEWTETLSSERLTGALLDRLTHHVSILEMNGESYRLAQSRKATQNK